MGELIGVLSGKGGTGKTSVCAGIATALALGGESVLCIDCDVGLRNLDIALGMEDSGALSFLEVCRGDYPLTSAAIHPEFPNLFFLTAPVHCQAHMIDGDAFEAMLQKARTMFDYVLMDAPAGIEAGFSLVARYADRILLVTGSDPASIRDARCAADTLELLGKHNIRLIINRVQKRMFSAMGLTVDDIMDKTGLPLLGIVPEDGAVVLSAACATALLRYTGKGAAAACMRLAKRLRGQSVPIRL